MDDTSLRYDTWVEEALRSVIRRALLHVAERGLPGDHHFYVTFRTDAEGAEVPDMLRAQYPEDMTIVLQHQFWDLLIGDDEFEVTLSFGGRRQRLCVPFEAITAFADPAVNFGLQLKQSILEDLAEDDAENAEDIEASIDPLVEAEIRELVPDTAEEPAEEERAADSPERSGEVIALDAFRKK